MTRRAIIKQLRADLEAAHRDMWQLAEDASFYRADRDRLQAIVDRQDETLLALWGLLEKQADEAPSDCAIFYACDYRHTSCSASCAEGCGAYVKGET